MWRFRFHFFYPLLLFASAAFGLELGGIIPPRFIVTVCCFLIISLLICWFTWKEKTMNIGFSLALPLLMGIFIRHIYLILGIEADFPLKVAVLAAGLFLPALILAFLLPIGREPKPLESVVLATLAIGTAGVITMSLTNVGFIAGLIAVLHLLLSPMLLLVAGKYRFGRMETKIEYQERMLREKFLRENHEGTQTKQ